MSESVAPGTFVTTTFDYDGGRLVTVYVPAGPIAAVVYTGDGQLTSRWAPDLVVGDRPATMVVGVHRHADDTVRLHEYSPGFDPQRFSAHEEFVVDRVRPWVADRFGVALSPAHTAVLGVSASAELALALGLRYPDIFGAVLCASPGAGYRPPTTFGPQLPRIYFVAGNQEPFFRANAERWAQALDQAGGDVIVTRRNGGHGDPFWREEFPRMVDWAFYR